MDINSELLILKAIKYGETSLIVHAFSELFGKIAIMVKGVRKEKRGTASIYHPGNYLLCQLNYNQQRNFQYIKEAKLQNYFWDIPTNIPKNCILIFCIEILHVILQDGDIQEDLYFFMQDFLKNLDKEDNNKIANYPFYFLIYIAQFLGYKIDSFSYNPLHPYFNIHTASFEKYPSSLAPVIDIENSALIAKIADSNLEELKNLKITSEERRYLQDIILDYLHIHVPYFRKIHSLEVLRAVLS